MAEPQVLKDIDKNALDIADLQDRIVSLSYVDRYNSLVASDLTGVEKTLTVSPIPKSGWVASGSNTYVSGDYKISCDSSANANLPYYAVDENKTNRWSTASGTTHWFKVELPSSIFVSKMKINMSSSFTYTVTIQGSNDDATWDDLYTNTLNSSSTTTLNEEITLTISNAYKYYRVYINIASAGTSDIRSLELSEYKIMSYSRDYTIEDLSIMWTNGSILLIETPEASTVGITSNSINTIPIDMILKSMTRYELVYNNGKFYAREVS